MAIRKIDNVWYAYWREGKRIIIRTTHCTDKRKATKVARDMMAAVRAYKIQKKLLPDSNVAHPYPPLVQKAIDGNGVRLDEMFAIATKYRPLSKRHQQVWNRFVKGVHKKYANEITPLVAVNYLDDQNFSSAKTYNNHKTILNTVFRLCFAETSMDSPFRNLLNKQLTDVKSHRNITAEEYNNIVGNVSPFWKFMTTLSYNTGMPKEVCLRFCPSMVVEINGVKWAKYLRGKTARFGRYCQVPLKQEVLDILPLADGDAPYVSAFTRPPLKEIDHGYKSILHSIGINDTADGTADFHSLRSSFITNCREHGIPDHAIRSMVGHVSSTTTDVYSHDTETPLQLLKCIEPCM